MTPHEAIDGIDLPVVDVLEDIRQALREKGAAVLEAPPGAGKTTLVPIALLDQKWLAGRRILMLEPRRLATRAAAARMADLLGEQVGETVGYRVRLDSKISEKTRIEVVTEGILTRMLQEDPELEGIGLVIFDEFHERSLHADLALALTLDARSSLRNGLRLLVMSATLDAERVASLLEDAPRIISEGRLFDVATRFRPPATGERIIGHASRIVREALVEEEGDVLVFLPGEGEIRRVHQQLDETGLPSHIDVHPLFGNLAVRDQQRAVEPSPDGRRKVVLSTNVAETSLTIEGVTVVVDSGLARRPRYSPSTGMTTLDTVRISRSSAEQRQGRAGRLAPGVCYRLWSPLDDEHLMAHSEPEILHADLVPLVLELAAWGVSEPEMLSWLDVPPVDRTSAARRLLRQLGMLDDGGLITGYGRRIVRRPVHPRLAHMMDSAPSASARGVAAMIAAVLSERDPIRGDAPLDPDITLRLELIISEAGGRPPRLPAGHAARQSAVRSALAVARRLHKELPPTEALRSVDAGRLLAHAYPDRLAARESDGVFRLRSGQRVMMPGNSVLRRAQFLVAAQVGGFGAMQRIHLAADISEDVIRELFGADLDWERDVRWDATSESVIVEEQERLDSLVLKRVTGLDPDQDEVAKVLLGAVRESELRLLTWDDEVRRLRERLQFLHEIDDEWPDFSDDALLETIEQWLLPFLVGVRRAQELARVDVSQALMSRVGWSRAKLVDELAPTHVTVPSGSRIRINYSDPKAPVLAVRLQEMFGCTVTPRVGGGRVPLTVHLLSPAHRPAQITQDLEGFWKTTYFDVRRDLRGRYPKHYWPDDPLAATPTSRAKPR